METFQGGEIPVQITDRDWRAFIQLRETARARFAEETLAQILAVCLDESLDEIQRQARVFALTAERQHEQAALFDDFRRATATLRLHLMIHHGLLLEEELEALSLDVRRKVCARY
jgi:hypothetical protein